MFTALGLGGCSSASSSNTTAEDIKKAEGSWTLVSGESDDSPVPEKEIKVARLIVVGDACSSKRRFHS